MKKAQTFTTCADNQQQVPLSMSPKAANGGKAKLIERSPTIPTKKAQTFTTYAEKSAPQSRSMETADGGQTKLIKRKLQRRRRRGP